MTEKLYAPIHPGEVLMEDFIAGFGITQNKLAQERVADQVAEIKPLQVA